MTTSPTCIWNLNATLGEGPIWLAADHCVWFVDIKQLQIHRFNTITNEVRSWTAPAQPAFLAPLKNGGFVVGLKTGLHRFDPITGAFTLLTVVEPSQPNNRLNDGSVDSKGRLWFGSMDDGERELTGALYRMSGDGKPQRLDVGYCITNGPAVSPDGRTLYHTCTTTRTIYAFDLNTDGSLKNRRIFARIAAATGYPDGSIVDAEGCLWTGLWNGWALQRFSPRAELLERIEMPCANITKAAFGGDDLRTLYITTARKGLSADDLQKQPLAGGLFSVRVDVPGLPQNELRLD